MSKSILIVGASSDLAISCAKQFADNGYDLQLAGRDIDKIKESYAGFNYKNISINFCKLDILDHKSFKKFIKELPEIPTIVLSAVGMLGNQSDNEKNINDSLEVLNSNFIGPSIFIGELANAFELRGYGTIIGISSIAGVRGRAKNYIYGSAKAGFTSYLSGLRNRLNKSNVHVLSVIPGYIDTKMIKDMNIPKFLLTSPDKISKKIFSSMNKNIIYGSFFWMVVSKLLLLIPEFIFKKLKLI